MDRTRDELAGVVDLFGALTRDELQQALSELAFRRGKEVRDAALAREVDDAVDAYHLVAVELDGEEVLAPGPVAFPTMPDGGEDLPHIMDVEPRAVDHRALGERTVARLREEAAAVAERGDADRAAELLDVVYDVEAWAAVDLDDVRADLVDAVEDD